MTIDRLLIICSVIELSLIACTRGAGCFTCFQWAAIVLISIKLLLAIIDFRRRNAVASAASDVVEDDSAIEVAEAE